MPEVPVLRLTDVADIAIVAVLLFAGLGWLRRSRARIALAGVAIASALFLLARQLELQMTVWILQGFFAVVALVLVLVFQEDLRRLFEQIAVWGLRRKPAAPTAGIADAITGAVRKLVADRSGALLVVPGREPIERHVTGGIALDGRLSEPLLLSLFDPHSPGHDGAVTVEGERVTRFALHLPLSTDALQLAGRGTRHAAALGLAERTDALCIVVSEERAEVSVARDGRLRRLPGPEALAGELGRFFADHAPARVAPAARLRRLAARWPEALLAAGASVGLWLLLVPGSAVGEFTRKASVVVDPVPDGLVVEAIEPPEVEVRFRGPRRAQLLVGAPAETELRIDAARARKGRRTFDVGPQQVRAPDGWTPIGVEPRRVRVALVPRPAPPEPAR